METRHLQFVPSKWSKVDKERMHETWRTCEELTFLTAQRIRQKSLECDRQCGNWLLVAPELHMSGRDNEQRPHVHQLGYLSLKLLRCELRNPSKAMTGCACGQRIQ